MSNREPRNSPPGAQPVRESSPPNAARLADELTAVLKLIATQNAKVREAEARADHSFERDGQTSHSAADDKALHDLDQSATIDRIQDEIRALEDRFAEAENGLRDTPPSAHAYGAPWDAENAEALTRTYEAADFGTPRDHYRSTAGPAGSAERSDRDWLENRFSEIAAKLENSLAEVRDSNSVQRIDGRLENLETRICDALDGLATRSDIERLRPADAGQLSRLDTIEGNLEAVLDRLSDERFYFDAPSAESRQLDVKALAETTADNVIARLSAMGLGSVGSAELAEIREAIDTIIEERRRHDEQSVAILDTLQQAMISVLDRVDALTHSVESKGNFRVDPPAFTPAKSDAGYAGAGSSVAEGTPKHHRDLTPPVEEASAGDDDVVPRYSEPAFLPLESDAPFGGIDTRSAGEEGDQPNLSAVDRIRQEMIADAKRAKQQASERAAKPVMAPSGAFDPSAPNAHVIPGEPAPKRRSRRKPSPASNGTMFGIQRRKLLVGAVIILFATAGALMMMRATSSNVPADAPASIEQPLSAEPGTATGVPAHDPERAPEHDGARETPVQPSGQSPGDRSHTDSPATGTETRRADTSPLQYDAPQSDPSRPLASNLRGITLQSSRALTPDQYALLGEKQAMAHFSEKLGEAAVHATPAALFPQAATDPVGVGSVANPDAGSAMASRTPLNLPPATVGPMSLRLAAAKGDPSAEFEVGARIAEGKGTDQDFKEAARWYQRSAAQGFAQAQYRLGTLYERGLGMPKDLARATVWYQRAAGNGNIKAMHNLAVLSAGPDAGESEYAAAVRWFTDAAERGLADSQYNLAILYENGLGPARDLKQAYMYFALAAQSGDQQAKRRQETLRGQFSAEDLSVAERMVETWRRKPVDRLANDARAAGEDWKSRADNSYGG